MTGADLEAKGAQTSVASGQNVSTENTGARRDGDDDIYRPDVDTTSVDERKLMRRIDVRVVPWLAVLYLLNFLDRGSIGNARLYHLTTDIGINDKQYLIALTVFFFPYALFEPASNVILKKIRPSLYLSSLMLLWGIVMTFHGFAAGYGSLIGLRFLLGFFESGLYPGIVYYISSWYKRSELGTRVALFFSSATVAGAFSGLLASAIQNMDGIGGKAGWSWIFILEGLLTVICAVISYWIVADWPQTAKFLSEAERVFVIRRLQSDMQFSAAGEELRFKYIIDCLKDWKTYLAMGIYMGFDGPLFAFSLFTPTIINQLGYKATAANLLSVPVYAWACIMTVAIGMLGDRYGHRGYINLALFGSGLLGYIILIVSKSAPLSYFGVYLAASSIYPTIPNSVAWVSSNVEGSTKRGVTLAMAIGFGNLNGAVTSNVYRSKDTPWYRPGHAVILAYIFIGWVCSLLYLVLLRRENRKRDAGERDEKISGVINPTAAHANGCFESVNDARRQKGDMWSGFRYTV